MRIAIDARMIKSGSMHGIARYVFQLLSCLREQGTAHEIYMLVNAQNPLLELSWPSHMHVACISAHWIGFREQWQIPLFLRKHQIDLFHAPSFIAPLFCPCPLVMTIHDLNHIVLRQFYTPFHQFYYHLFVKSCIRRSAFVLTVSQFSKREILSTMGISEAKVFVTYNGVESHYKPIKDIRQLAYIRDLYELPERFLLCLSNNKPHKNVRQLVEAYCLSQIEMPLVLACEVDGNLIRLADSYGKKHLLYFVKFIEEGHLPAVYTLAELFVYPSTYEGFGLPPLEALACGVPVAVSNSTSLPEVVGESGFFLPPISDTKVVAQALESILQQAPQRRLGLQIQASEISSKFSWKKMTKETLLLYESHVAP